MSRKPLPAFNGETERLYDLVRYQRAELHEAGLITDEEYAAMMSDKGASRKRLEAYDDLRTALAAKERENGELKAKLADAEAGSKEFHRALCVETEGVHDMRASRDEAVRLLRAMRDEIGQLCSHSGEPCIHDEVRAFLATERT